MSHLSILPTVLRDADMLAACLEGLGYSPQWGGTLAGFAGEQQAVLLQVRCRGEVQLGWRRQPDGCLALVGDLQRLSRSASVQRLLSTITRRYATALALDDARRHLATARVSVTS
ncbi:MAG: DUF1257 domain-containing protein [Cyanobium sp.]|nr:DUF1257 domain-containing protein [Cyanobium sp.]